MKKIIALLLLAALVLSAAACGGKTPVETTTETTTEELTTDPAVTEPEVGRIGEKTSFYVYVPEHWCKMEYTKDDSRLRLFDIPSAPKIEEGKTAEVEIKVAAEAGKQEDVDAAVAELLKIEGAKKGKDAKLGGGTFTVVTYTEPKEKRAYTAYIGLGGGSLASVTLKGIKADDEDAAAILRSISFKPLGKRAAPTTTTKAAKTTTAAEKTTKAAGEADKTTASAKTTTAAAKTTTAAAKSTTAAAKSTTAAAKSTTAAAKTTTAAAKTTTAAAKTTKPAA